MNPDQQLRLFKPFSQGDASITRQYGGSGLGLVITQRLIHLLDGELVFESEPGRGSIFRVRLPIPAPDEVTLVEPKVATDQTNQSIAKPQRHLDCRVLIIDDRRDVRYISQHFLERAGARVTTAEDGEQGIALSLQAIESGEPFDVILMDMQMPKMDGLEATRRLRDQGVGIPIIALTADAMKGDRERFLRGGCDDHLPKPISHVALIEMVGHYCQDVSPAELNELRAKIAKS